MKKVRNMQLIEIHKKLSSELENMHRIQIPNSFQEYNLVYGIQHALSIPEKELAYRVIERWILQDNIRLVKRALEGLLCLLRYPSTIQRGFEILDRLDNRIRNILSMAVPYPLQEIVKLFADAEKKEIDLLSSVFLLNAFELVFDFFNRVLTADLLEHQQTREDMTNLIYRPTFSMHLKYFQASQELTFTGNVLALSMVPSSILQNIQTLAQNMNKLRNDLMHGVIDARDKESLQILFDSVWDLRLLFFPLCEYGISLEHHGKMELFDTEIDICTPIISIQNKTKFTLWPFFIVHKNSDSETWYALESIKKDTLRFRIRTYMDPCMRNKKNIQTGLKVKTQQEHSIESLRKISPLEFEYM